MTTNDPQAAAEIVPEINPTPVVDTSAEVALDAKQLEAVQLCCDMTQRVVCITGPAGSGKTTIMRQVHRLLTSAGHNLAVCAPTGKASKRVYEATNIRARTIHLLLEYTHPGDPDPKTGKPTGYSVPRRYQDRRLDENIIIADEYAMVHTELHRNLMNAIPAGGRALLFGDANQLPPIEENKLAAKDGSPFKAMMARFPTVALDKVHRQGEGSGILSNAARALIGRSPMQKDDFAIVITDDPVKILSIIIRRMEQEQNVNFKGLDTQIIVPSKRTWTGTKALNGMLQQMYERKEDDFVSLERNDWDKKDGPITVRIGTKVIQVKNDYALGIYNGETGLVVEMNKEFGTIVVDFGDRAVEIPPELDYLALNNSDGTPMKKYYNPQKNIDLAYALTTHKCQGSEYTHVIYLMNKSMQNLQIRPNFYTGITRARKHVTVVTDSRSLMSCLTRTETTF